MKPEPLFGKKITAMRIIVPLFAALYLISIVFTFFVYGYVQGELRDGMLRNINTRVEHRLLALDTEISRAFAAARFFISDPDIELFAAYPNMTTAQRQKMESSVSKYMTAFDTISSVYLINPVSDKMLVFNSSATYKYYDKSAYYDSGIFELLISDGLSRSKIYPRTVVSPFDEAEYFTVVGYDGYRGNSGPVCAVVLNFPASFLRQAVRDDSPGASGFAIVSGDDTIFLDGGLSEMLSENVDASAGFASLISSSKADFAACKVGGTAGYLVSSAPGNYGFRLVQLVSSSGEAELFGRAQSSVMLISVVMLLLSTLLALVLSRVIATPVMAILRRGDSLELRAWRAAQEMKSSYLHTLLYGGFVSDSAWRQAAEEYGINFTKIQRIILMNTVIDGGNNLLDALSAAEYSALTYAAGNVMAEICADRYGLEVEVVEQMQRGTLYLILFTDKELPDGETLHLLSRELCKTLREALGVSANIVYSNDSVFPIELGDLRRRIDSIMQNRPFWEKDASIEISSFGSYEQLEYYDALLRNLRTLRDSIASENAEAAYTAIDDIFAVAARSEDIARISRYLTRAFLFHPDEVSRWAIAEMKSLPEISVFSDTGAVKAQFSTFILKFFQKLEEYKSSPGYSLAARADKIIAERFADPNLNVEKLADELGISANYLGRSYLSQASLSIVDKLNQTRVSAACEMLLNTNLSVSDISERCGYYNTSYFYRVFKNLIGVTPVKFRSAK